MYCLVNKSYFTHNYPTLANAKIKANLFALIKNRVFDKMYVIKNFRQFSWIATRV
ncbi:hypothetical protein C21_01572 [Arenibacter sp. NBRC 103722]|nr:hypothetical protein C21_01572 [Arenibacter sp. NBRC 103722]